MNHAAPKIMFIVNIDWFFLSHRLAIAQEAIRQGYEVHVACALTNGGPALRQHGIVVHALPISRSGTHPGQALAAIFAILSLLRKVSPDIVHLVTIKPVLLGGIAARMAGVPVVAAVSGLGYVFIARGRIAQLRRWAVGRLYRLALGGPRTKVIFQNKSDQTLISSYAKLAEQRSVLIRGSGVNLADYQPAELPGGPPVALFAARLLVDKGLREFVAAAYRLREAGVDARFIVAGDADDANPASVGAEELARWRSEGVVELIGHQGDMAALMRSAHFVVLPSYREGLPKVLIEAAACGRAVITTDVPGCRDAVEAGKTALLVPARDSEALAQAMEKLIVDQQLCAAMGAAGRDLAERCFSVADVAAAHMKIYSEILERGA